MWKKNLQTSISHEYRLKSPQQNYLQTKSINIEKKLYTMTNWDLSQKYKDILTSKKMTTPYEQNFFKKRIISIDAEKNWKISTHFHLRNTQIGIEGNFLNLIKGIYKNPAASILLNQR